MLSKHIRYQTGYAGLLLVNKKACAGGARFFVYANDSIFTWA